MSPIPASRSSSCNCAATVRHRAAYSLSFMRSELTGCQPWSLRGKRIVSQSAQAKEKPNVVQVAAVAAGEIAPHAPYAVAHLRGERTVLGLHQHQNVNAKCRANSRAAGKMPVHCALEVRSLECSTQRSLVVKRKE